ncbi:MAG: T9SS type A sorting domain-containing protein [Bacteroidales bacterium]|nr:T9SS type A sorting domain-containing protein [Bacteroidales bacterium]MBP3820989.1 T9SS type A sorting domain-containing protein [bacterium]
MAKRILKLLTLTALLFAGGNALAQNQWDESNITTIENESLSPAIYCEGISYSFGKDGIKIYNSDFENIKTIPLSLFFPSNTEYSGIRNIHCLTKNVFTNSNKYEFVVSGEYQFPDEYKYHKIYCIYNEDGELLYSFGDYENIESAYIINNKLVVTLYKEDYDSYTKIFTLANSVKPSSVATVMQQNQAKLYPNPARQSVTLEYNIQGQMQEMQIVDMQGRVVASYLLDPSQKQVKINTSNYKKGVYVYRYGNNSGKFVVE